MVETITPVVHGGRRSRWSVAVVLHAVAAAATAAGFGALLAAAGAALRAPWGSGARLVVAALAAWAMLHEAAGVAFPIPQLRRQVPDWWRTFFSPLASASLYGAALGVGFFTYLLHSTLVVVSVAAFASGRPILGAALVGPFGLARGLSAIVAVGGPNVVQALADVAAHRRPLAAIHAVVLAAVSVTLLAGATGSIDVGGTALACVALAFAWSSGWKAVRPRAWRAVLDGYALGAVTPLVAILVPAFEALVVVCAVAGAGRVAAVLALASLLAFSAAVIRRQVAGAAHIACGCFDASESSVARVLFRNAVLAAAATMALGGGLPPAVRAPSRADALPIALSVAGIAGVTLATTAVRRSLGRGRA